MNYAEVEEACTVAATSLTNKSQKFPHTELASADEDVLFRQIARIAAPAQTNGPKLSSATALMIKLWQIKAAL